MSAPKRVGRPKREYLDSLQNKPKKADWDRLLTACLEALIAGENDIIVAFSYVTKLPKDFPRGILEHKVEDKNVHRIKARKLLRWLYKHGYTTITIEDVKSQQMHFGKAELKMERMFEIDVDIPQDEADNSDIQAEGNQPKEAHEAPEREAATSNRT